MFFTDPDTSNPNDQPIEFHASTDSDGYDIYFWESLLSNKNILRTTLTHEIAETFFKMFGYGDNAHNMAIFYENRYKSNNLNEDEKIKLEETRNKHEA